MSNLLFTRLTASGSPTGLVRLRCWVEQQNAEYNRTSGSVEDGPLRLGSDNLLAFEQRDGGFPHDVVADLQSLFPDLTFAGYAWSEIGWSCQIEIRYGYRRVRFEDEDDWDNDLARTDYFINPDDDVDAEFSTGAAPTAQPLPADFIEWMMCDDTAVMVPKELNTPPGWPYEADPDLSGLGDIALIWELKRRGRAVIALGPHQVNQVYARATERSLWDSAPLPPVVDGLLEDPLIAERVERQMGRSGIEEITTIL
jgi:hypothetical protein